MDSIEKAIKEYKQFNGTLSSFIYVALSVSNAQCILIKVTTNCNGSFDQPLPQLFPHSTLAPPTHPVLQDRLPNKYKYQVFNYVLRLRQELVVKYTGCPELGVQTSPGDYSIQNKQNVSNKA